MTTLSNADIERIVLLRRSLKSGVAREIRTTSLATTSDIAKAVGCHPITVGKWENGKSVPRADMALKLAEVYGGLAVLARELEAPKGAVPGPDDERSAT